MNHENQHGFMQEQFPWWNCIQFSVEWSEYSIFSTHLLLCSAIYSLNILDSNISGIHWGIAWLGNDWRNVLEKCINNLRKNYFQIIFSSWKISFLNKHSKHPLSIHIALRLTNIQNPIHINFDVQKLELFNMMNNKEEM